MKKLSMLKRTAYHEAGHLVASFFLGIPIKYGTVTPTKDSCGHIKRYNFPKWFKPDIDTGFKIRQRIEKEIQVSFAGHAAEFHLTGRKNHIGASYDNHNAIELAMYVNGSNQQTEAFINWMRIRTVEWVKLPAQWRAIKALANELLRKRTLSKQEVKEIIIKSAKNIYTSNRSS